MISDVLYILIVKLLWSDVRVFPQPLVIPVQILGLLPSSLLGCFLRPARFENSELIVYQNRKDGDVDIRPVVLSEAD